MICILRLFLFFFFNDTATTEIYTLSLHDALPILTEYVYDAAGNLLQVITSSTAQAPTITAVTPNAVRRGTTVRSEEHTSELQSQSNLVCRLLLEKKKTNTSKYD